MAKWRKLQLDGPSADSLKQIRSLGGRPGRSLGRSPQGGPYLRRRCRIPSALVVKPGRYATSRALPAAGINADRLPYSLDWENLPDAERNLRVRLTETRP